MTQPAQSTSIACRRTLAASCQGRTLSAPATAIRPVGTPALGEQRTGGSSVLQRFGFSPTFRPYTGTPGTRLGRNGNLADITTTRSNKLPRPPRTEGLATETTAWLRTAVAKANAELAVASGALDGLPGHSDGR